jgi:hypothetical protein
MKQIDVTIQGVSPLLCNRFTDEAQLKASSGAGMAMVGNKGSPKEQAEKKLYPGYDGEPTIPVSNVFRCIIDAGKFFKNGRSKVTTQKTSMIPACLEIDGIELPITHTDPWEVDTRAVRIPSTGGRILAHRPKFNDWRLSFTLTLDDDFMTDKMLRDIVDAAGKRIGLGDYRPDCKGPFGKFVVTQWQESEEVDIAA